VRSAKYRAHQLNVAPTAMTIQRYKDTPRRDRFAFRAQFPRFTLKGGARVCDSCLVEETWRPKNDWPN